LFGSDFEVDYGSEEQASIAYKTLAVDREVRLAVVSKTLLCSTSKEFICLHEPHPPSGPDDFALQLQPDKVKRETASCFW
jgi:hypothetical protein